MIVVTNTIRVKKGHGREVAKRFENSKGVDRSPGFVRMEVLLAEDSPDHDELKVCTHWESKEAFEGWVGSDAFKEAHAHRGGRPQEGHGGPAAEGEKIMLGSQLSTHVVLVSKQA